MSQFKYFTIQWRQLMLTKQGITKLREIASGSSRPANTWSAARLQDGPLKVKLTYQQQQLKVADKIDRLEVSDHHIFPGNGIKNLVSFGLNQNGGQGNDALVKYLNSKQGIINKIQEQIFPKTGLPDEENAIVDVLSSIFWLQKNLVLGPQYRIDDPGQYVDEPLLNQQDTKETVALYQQIISESKRNQAKALALFLADKKINSVVWSTEGGIRVVGRRADLPGTAGYAYDQYK